MLNKTISDLQNLGEALDEDETNPRVIRVTLNLIQKDLEADRARLLMALQNTKQMTKVLGAGVRHIATPDGFFMLWNETEIEVSKLIRELRDDESVS